MASMLSCLIKSASKDMFVILFQEVLKLLSDAMGRNSFSESVEK